MNIKTFSVSAGNFTIQSAAAEADVWIRQCIASLEVALEGPISLRSVSVWRLHGLVMLTVQYETYAELLALSK